MVVCSVLESDAAATLSRIRSAPRGCALVEIRADRLSVDEIREAVARAGRPVAVAVRREGDGGTFDGSEQEREGALVAALDAGAAFVDVELDSVPAALADGEHAGRVILSHHGVSCEAAALGEAYRRMAPSAAARLKIVAGCSAPSEVAALPGLLATAAQDGRPLACFALGRFGRVSRLLAPSWGSWATYGSPAAAGVTAAGQLAAAEMLDLYDVLRIGPETRRFALLGREVFRSPSPAMHVAGYARIGLDARYLPIEADRLDDAAALLGPDGPLAIEAAAFTMPFKTDAARRCRRLDSVARAAGAVNTVVLAAEGWVGYNTDGPAVRELASRCLELRGSRVAVAGCGGFGRAAAAALRDAGASVVLFNRTGARAEEAGRALGLEWRELDALEAFEWDALVQATPLGTRGERLLDAGRLCGRFVLDAVYGARTPLVQDAVGRGLAVADGLDLLAAQAVEQFERMTGAVVPERVLRRAGRIQHDTKGSS